MITRKYSKWEAVGKHWSAYHWFPVPVDECEARERIRIREGRRRLPKGTIVKPCSDDAVSYTHLTLPTKRIV